MARVAAKDGVGVIIATPHANLDEGVVTPELIRQRVAVLNDAIHAAGIDITVLPGAEISSVDNLIKHLEAGRVMTLADKGKHLLIELPFSSYPNYVPDLFFNLQLMGFVPIIAHPERSGAARLRLDIIRELAQRGALLQLNADSICGKEGRVVRTIAQKLLREDLVSFIASDGHDPKRRPPVISPARAAMRRLGGDAVFARLTQSGPARLLRDPSRPGRTSSSAAPEPA
ncbi:MAG: hypothetical protein HPY44_14840 [Armatimonadetes bacterium]|nr:hypothetical protein [Armatimonadota bacterium]